MKFNRKTQKKRILLLGFPLLFFGVSVALPVQAGWFGDLLGDTFGSVISALLYAIFQAMGVIVSVAVTIFSWVINPNLWHDFFNLPQTYELWKFVRDFVNLFFILGLLFAAFATVFQIQAYNYKKLLLKLVIAALLVNFSFPISRAIIDVANVPMYFFAESLLTDPNNGGSALGGVLGTSQLEDILIPPDKYDRGDIGSMQILLATVFLFLFGVTLLVLAVQLVIRLVALLILVILSPVGFVAGAVPGMQKYGKSWWDYFLKYAFFGPAVLFMLVLAVNLMAGVTGGGSKEGMRGFAQSNSSEAPEFIAGLALGAVPIILLWFAMGMAGKFAIAGSGMATSYGQKAFKTTGRVLLSPTRIVTRPVKTRAKGAGQGLKKGLDQGKLFGWKYGEKGPGKWLTGKYWREGGEATEAKYRGFVSGGSSGKKTELDKLHQKRVNEKVKEYKDNNVNTSARMQDLGSSDLVTKQAAAVSLAETGDIRTSAALEKAIKALETKDKEGNEKYDQDMLFKVLDKAEDSAYDDVTVDTYKKIADNEDMYLKENGEFVMKDGKRVLNDSLSNFNDKLKKAGKVDVLVNYDTEQGKKAGKSDAESYAAAFKERVGKMKAEDLIKQKDLTKHPNFIGNAALAFGDRPGQMQKILDKAYEKGSPEVQNAWLEVQRRAPVIKKVVENNEKTVEKLRNRKNGQAS